MSLPFSVASARPRAFWRVTSAWVLAWGTITSLNSNVMPVSRADNTRAGTTRRTVLTPTLRNAVSSLFAVSLLYASRVANRVAIGKDSTRKRGRLRSITCSAVQAGRPSSTSRRTSSNITPMESPTTVKAATAKSSGARISPISHRSSRGIRRHQRFRAAITAGRPPRGSSGAPEGHRPRSGIDRWPESRRR